MPAKQQIKQSVVLCCLQKHIRCLHQLDQFHSETDIVQSQSFKSSRYLLRAFRVVQHPNAVIILRAQSRRRTSGDTREPTEPYRLLEDINKDTLRATLPTAPVAFSANAHTVSEHDREEKARQHDIMINPSAVNQSESIRRRVEPIRKIWAVRRSSLSHRKSNVESAGPNVSPAHSRSFWIEMIGGKVGDRTERTEEQPIRRKPIDDALWFLNS